MHSVSQKEDVFLASLRALGTVGARGRVARQSRGMDADRWNSSTCLHLCHGVASAERPSVPSVPGPRKDGLKNGRGKAYFSLEYLTVRTDESTRVGLSWNPVK